MKHLGAVETKPFTCAVRALARVEKVAGTWYTFISYPTRLSIRHFNNLRSIYRVGADLDSGRIAKVF
jgi:hypothetical protein